MSLARAAVLSLVVALGAPQAVAQDLDIPMPNAGAPKKSKASKRRGSKKATAKKPAAAAPSEELELDVPLPGRKPATANKAEPVGLDEDLIPTVGKSELVVKLGGGIKGARLFVDNKDMGTLPLSAPLQVEPGAHSIIVRKPGFADFSSRFTARKGKATEVNVTLEAVAGLVSVTSEVPGATVSINGQPRGQVPLQGMVLKPGTYEIVVSKEGYEPDKRSILVKVGREQTVAASLKPLAPSQPVAVASTDRPQQPVLTPSEPAVTPPQSNPLSQEVPQVAEGKPWFKRWYVWAGVGVVAAAATGAAVAAQGSKPLTADAVCGGPCDGTINGITRARAR